MAFARDSFNPQTACGDLLLSGNAGDKTMSVFWASGYLAKTESKSREITVQHLNGMYAALGAVCKQSPKAAFADVVEALATAQVSKALPAPVVTAPPAGTAPAAQTANPPSTAQMAPPPAQPETPAISAREVLWQFYQPDADRSALLMSLKPAAEDVRAVYAEPLASNMIATYNQMFQPGVKFGPKPGYQGLYTFETTTQKLKNREAVQNEFPGGYKKVLPYIKSNQVIVRFKFVKEPGQTTGLASDGLIFVNGRWVFMPKPWLSLKQ